MNRNNNEALSFDDVTLVPQYSDILSRQEVSLKSGFLEFPVISSPMNTVTEVEMAEALSRNGGLGILHRYNTIEQQSQMTKKVWEQNFGKNVAVAIGVKDDYLERATECRKNGANIICIDVAHGHHILVKNAIYELRKKFDDIHIMAGNVATPEAFMALTNWGANSIRVGIAGGSICKTFIETHHGLSTLQSILDITEYFKKREYLKKNALLIADGGIKTAGNIVCALAAGADMVICGSVFAGTDESPGQIIEINGKKCKPYFGMASLDAQKMYKSEANSDEGVATFVPTKGSVLSIISSLKRGMKSGFSYSGARNIKELQQNCEFRKQTHSAYLQGTPHIFYKEGTEKNV